MGSITPGAGRALVAACLLAGVLVVTGCTAGAGSSRPSGPSGPSTAGTDPQDSSASAWALPPGPRIVFRDTEPGDDFGRVASVALGAPAGERTSTRLSCERVYATRATLSCMSKTGIDPVGYRETLYEPDGTETHYWPLPGVPSRTRLSADSTLAAWTAFVAGESYANVKFSTQTEIAEVHGTDYGPLSTFTFLVDAKPYAALDLNFWGVTFASDDNRFYATAASAGHTWLVRGNLRGRSLVAVRDGVECPSLSPDGTRVAYKKNLGTLDAPRWTLAVADLATETEKQLPLTGDVDDQAEWLDGSTLLFGRPSTGAQGDSDIYAVPADGSAPETLLIRHASSPAVVR